MKVNSGSIAEQSGVYKCTRCGREITLQKGDVIPLCPKCHNNEFVFVK